MASRSSSGSSAGGVGAIRATLHHLRRETGLVRGAKLLAGINQEGGFDCPGCAWPDPEKPSRFEFCENGAKAVAEEATRKRATPEVVGGFTLAELRAMSDFELGQLGRLTQPMVVRRGDSRLSAISWDEAIDLAAGALGALASPHEALFYTSGRTSNEAAFLYQLFVRSFGTNNLPDCSNMCHESSGVGLLQALGTGKGTVTLEDFEHADLIFVIGQNPGTNHPRMLSTLREAAARGATIVSVNPLREAGLVRFAHPQKPLDMLTGGQPLASEFLQVRIGGDVALLQGLAKAVFEEEDARPGEVIDRAFIGAFTSEFEAYERAIRASDWGPLVEISGVAEDDIRRVAARFARSKKVIACWAMGITQHKNAVGNVQEIVNLMLLGGHVGRLGAGLCPVRGHSNVQGDRTMGIMHNPNESFLAALERAVPGLVAPREVGMDTVDGIEAMLDGRAKVFVGLGGNFLSAAPDTAATARALEGCQLTAHISTKLNRSHLHGGAIGLVLPCLGRTEIDVQGSGPQVVTVEDSMSMVHASRGSLDPASRDLLSEPAIIARLAEKTLQKSAIAWRELADDYERIRGLIEQVVPGFVGFRASVRAGRRFRIPQAARERRFVTATNRARFMVHPLPRLTLPEGHLRLMTLRSHDQYNTTIYGLDDRYRGLRGRRRVVLVHREDLAARGIEPGEVIDLVSISEGDGSVRRGEGFEAVAYDIPRGGAAAYFPEANVLVPLGDRATLSQTPVSKSVVIRLEKRP